MVSVSSVISSACRLLILCVESENSPVWHPKERSIELFTDFPRCHTVIPDGSSVLRPWAGHRKWRSHILNGLISGEQERDELDFGSIRDVGRRPTGFFVFRADGMLPTQAIFTSDTLTAKLCSGKDDMSLEEIVDQLHAERGRLDEAIAALEGLSPRRRGRPPKGNGRTLRRGMSAAARKRISAAMKDRWAARKKGSQTIRPTKGKAKKPAGRPQMSLAARKKLSALMRARWAARKQPTGVK